MVSLYLAKPNLGPRLLTYNIRYACAYTGCTHMLAVPLYLAEPMALTIYIYDELCVSSYVCLYKWMYASIMCHVSNICAIIPQRFMFLTCVHAIHQCHKATLKDRRSMLTASYIYRMCSLTIECVLIAYYACLSALLCDTDEWHAHRLET